MKLLNKYLISFAALAFAACSSMDIDDAEAVSENFPEDFDDAVYMELHPELVSMQVRNYIADYNASVKESLVPDSIIADSNAFSADTALLHQIYATPCYGGYGETRWADAWAPVITDSLVCQLKEVYVQLNLWKKTTVKDSAGTDSTSEGKVDSTTFSLVAPITVVKDSADTTKFVSVTGMPKDDTTATDPVTYVISDSLDVLTGKLMGTTKTDTASCDTIPNEKPGSLKSVDVTFLHGFNFIDTRDDWKKIKAVPIDTFAISLQYVLYGESHGWAYRKCKDTEKDNPKISEEYPVTKRYCVDAKGVVREIK